MIMKFIYSHQRSWKGQYNYCCKDYKCKGRGKFYFKTGEFKITQIRQL